MDEFYEHIEKQLNDEQDLNLREVSDELDELTDILFSYPQYQDAFRQACHKYNIIDPDDINHYQYDEDKYNQAWDHDSDTRWFDNAKYQPVDDILYYDLLRTLDEERKA